MGQNCCQRCCYCFYSHARNGRANIQVTPAARGSEDGISSVELRISSRAPIRDKAIHQTMFLDVKTPSLLGTFDELRRNSSYDLTGGISWYSCASESFSPARLPQEVSKLSGNWMGIPGTIEGFEEFLNVSGIGWAKRKLVTSMVKKFVPKQEISNQGNRFLIVIPSPFGVDTKEFIVDGPTFESTFGPEKVPGTGQASWDGDVLVMQIDCGTKTIEQRRWLDGDILRQTDKLTMGGRTATLKRAYKLKA